MSTTRSRTGEQHLTNRKLGTVIATGIAHHRWHFGQLRNLVVRDRGTHLLVDPCPVSGRVSSTIGEVLPLREQVTLECL